MVYTIKYFETKISRSTVVNVDAVNRLSIELDTFTLGYIVIGICATFVFKEKKKARKKLIKILAFYQESRALNANRR